MTLVFPEELATGVEEVDEQHRAFYRHLNTLHEAMRRHDLPEAGRVVEFMVGYAADHFASEERLMIDAGFTGFPEHLAAHLAFTRDVHRWRARIGENGPTAGLVVEFSSWLTGWLGQHIRTMDRAMARHLRQAATRGR